MQQRGITLNQATIVIKKYPNRRLYDTSSRRYINLDDLAALIRKGDDVRVVDAKTGEDLTRVTLSQIIMEDTKEQPTGLPVELLRQLVMASDRAGQEVIMWYLKSAFDTYQKVQEVVQGGLEDARSAALSPLNMMKSLLSRSGRTSEAELEQLRLRVAELEARLEQVQARPGRATRKSPVRKAKSRPK